MTIKELEKRSGLPRTAIRFYEQQGLITPERRENNYRDYSEEDARTLEKVKLLRQLSLDLEAIRALKEGNLSLAQVMERQAEVLEGDRADLGRYAQVCRELSQAQADYDSLEPGPWLEELSQTQLPPTRRVDPAQEDGLRGPHPWRRYLARFLDQSLMILVCQVIQFQVLHWYAPPILPKDGLQSVVSVVLGSLLLVLVEPILLCTWGYTPGKWLLGLQVRQPDGRKPTWDQATQRTLLVLWRGQGLHIPLYEAWRTWLCYVDYTDGKPLPWEKEAQCTARSIHWGRWAAFFGCWLALATLSECSTRDSYVPPYPDAPLTPAQVVENFNFYERRYSCLDDHSSVLAPDGSWEVIPAVYQNKEWKQLSDESFGEWSAVAFETNPDGTVAAMQVDFSPKGDPYRDVLDVETVLNETLSQLMLAADPSGEARNPYQFLERQFDAHLDCGRLVEMPFQGAGAVNQIEGPGGMTVTLEVTQCEGYQADPGFKNYSWLVQEEPGAGTLSFHITLTLPET